MASIASTLEIISFRTRQPGSTQEPTTPASAEGIAEAFRISAPGASEQRATKKRKLNNGPHVEMQNAYTFDPSQSIVLARVGLDLRLPDRQCEPLKLQDASPSSVELFLESCGRPEPHVFDISLWNTITSAALDLRATGAPALLDQIAPHLEIAALVATTKEGRKRSNRRRIPFSRAVLSARGAAYQSAQLEIELRWSVGFSAVETQSSRPSIREDLAILENYLPDDAVKTRTSWSLADFYSAVHVPPTDERVSPCIPQSLVETKLYPFQQRAVSWLLLREGLEFSEQGDVKKPVLPSVSAPVTFKPSQDATGRACYISHLRGMVVTDISTVWNAARELRGGILAEEMGLGKTVELIALMCLHKREISQEQLHKQDPQNNLIPSTATLIITPPSILGQWRKEINTHAPELKVLHYKGLPPDSAPKKDHEGATVESLLQYDVVLTTYNVLSKEIHFATPAPDRPLRHAPKHERKNSPLVQIQWWRVCLDEAQMVESGVSQAAKVARIIPRVNAWAVSGTPLRKDIQDLRGLLTFLWYEPFASSKVLWDRLDKPSFREIFNQITLRHTKDKIRDELQLPVQKRIVITVPFTAIEEQNYGELIRQMCDACWLSPEGAPLREDRNIDHPEVIERMREWLMRLRQTCLHAHVGRRNRKAFGARNGPLRTVDEVLEVMIDQNDSAVKAEAREVILSEIKRGHIRAHAKDVVERSSTAMPYYERALKETQNYVKACRDEIAEEKKRLGLDSRASDDVLDDEDEEHDDKTGRIVTKRRALRSFLELEHACSFFIGTAHYQLKTNERMTVPKSVAFYHLQRQEDFWYEKAKEVRKELLKDSQTRAQRHMALAKRDPSTPLREIAQIPDLGGIESRKVLEMVDEITDTLNAQATHLKEWRKKIIDILTAPLVDQDEGKETTGDEYEDSTHLQDQLYVYLMAFRALVADRNAAVSGLHDPLVDHEMKVAERLAKNEKDAERRGHAPELLLQLAHTRRSLQPQTAHGSLKGAVSALRSLSTSLQWRADARASVEMAIAEKHLAHVQRITTEQAKLVADLEKDQEVFRTTMNYRLEFYRQLQHISDTVAPWKEELDPTFDSVEYRNVKRNQEAKEKSLAGLKTKQAYLTNLRSEGLLQGNMTHECIICQDEFEIGVFTSCGHKYCKGCIQQWWNEHRTCPLCKQKLHARDFKTISFKPSEITAQEETHGTASPSHPSSPSSATSSIYSDISDATMREIKMIDLEGSYGSKIDMIARHLLWIRHNDPGAKTIIFSQFSDFLGVLRNACDRWKIGTSSIHDKNGIQEFQQDAAKECFLLDARTDASGLNLVNATYVFLCEPLINPAIELQAVSRVHRIGQQRSTTVFMYLVSNTVEEAIYDISVARRMQHMSRTTITTTTTIPSSSSSSSSPSPPAADINPETTSPALRETMLDKANSAELEAAPLKQLLRKAGDGEVVRADDLWSCLFGAKAARSKEKSEALDREIGRHFAAAAAEARARDAASSSAAAAAVVV